VPGVGSGSVFCANASDPHITKTAAEAQSFTFAGAVPLIFMVYSSGVGYPAMET
jgi:hypothetical protein